MGRWRVVKTDACNFTQLPPYGGISVLNDLATFSAPSWSRAYPYLWTRDGVFSADQDWVVDIRMRYVSLVPHGAGFFAKKWPSATPSGTNSPYDVGTAKCGSFGGWGDNATGVTVYLMGESAGVPGSSSAFHDYRFQYTGGKYFVFVDGQLVMGPVRSVVQPDRLWLGNPTFIYGLGTTDWSVMSFDYVRFSEPAFIDGDGNGTHDADQTWTPTNVSAALQNDADTDGLPDGCDPSPGQGALGPAVPDEQIIGPGSGTHAEDPSGEFADPVSTATGAFVNSVMDVALPGTGVPFSFTRSYTSSDTAVGPLGPGWTHSYAPTLSIGLGGDAVVRGEDGQRVTYTRATDGSFIGGAGARSQLAEVMGGGYELVRKDQVRYRFDSAGRLTSMRDRNGQGLTFAYNGADKLATVTDSASRVITFTHNADGLLTKIELPDARSVSYGYTGGRLTTVTDLRGGPTTYTYDAAGRLKSAVNPNDHTVFDNTYGADGRVIEQVDALGESTTFSWDAATQTATAVDPRGHAWKHVYKNNVLLREIDPLGNTTTHTTDEDLNRVAITDPRGKKTTMGYDGRGNLLRVTAPAPLGYRQTFVYDAQNNVTRTTDGRGQRTDYEYDAAGNLVKVTEPDPDGAGPAARPLTTYGRQPGTGRLTSVQDARGKTTTFGYDTDGNVASVTTPLGFVTTMAYDGTGRLMSRVEPRGNVVGANPADYRTTFSYDAADHLLTSTNPLGHTTTYEYDPVGNLKKRTDAKSHVTQYGYDEANHLQTVTAPDLTVTTYTYDETGNLVTRTDAKNHTTTYTYDDANRLTKITSPLGKEWTYVRDPAGNVIQSVDANGNATPLDPNDGKTAFTFDEIGRLKAIDYSDATPDVSYSYDANSNRMAMSDGSGTASYIYDSLDRLKSVARGTDTYSYEYDQIGNVTSRTYPDGTAAAYAYDDDARLQTVASGGQTTTYGYDQSGNLVSTALPSGTGITETRTYDRAGRLQELRNTRGGTTLSSFAYTLDPVGNPTQVVTPNGTRTFAHDALDRLTEVCYQLVCAGPLDPLITRWTYDAVGNRASEQRLLATTTYTYDADDRLTQSSSALGGTVSYGYDANGNQTSAGTKLFTYDLAGRMRTATVGALATMYAYDGDGTRVVTSSVGATTKYLWDPNYQLPQLGLERDGLGNLRRRYVHGHAPVSLTPGALASPSYYTADGLGSIVGLHSNNGENQWTYDYEPFGAQRSATQDDPAAPANPLRFTGQLLDAETNLYHLRARQYDPALGRFTATDPVAPALTDPYVAAYVYVNNRPLALIDPSGLSWKDVVRDAAGAFVSGLSAANRMAGHLDDVNLPAHLAEIPRAGERVIRVAGPGIAIVGVALDYHAYLKSGNSWIRAGARAAVKGGLSFAGGFVFAAPCVVLLPTGVPAVACALVAGGTGAYAGGWLGDEIGSRLLGRNGK
jgi:RHS repeat-associated protein